MIAGYEPSTGNAYLLAAVDRAITDFQVRGERDKIIVCRIAVSRSGQVAKVARLIATTPDRLPEKPGSMLISLA